MRLTEKQTIAYDLALSGEKNFILYGGAIRGGKTWWLLLTFIALCSRYPKSRWAIIRQSLPTLKRTTLVSWNKIVNEGLHQHIKSFNHSDYTVTFNNGSQIIFMAESYDDDKDLNRFRGLEINGAGVDELNEIQEVTFDKLFERSGSWNGATIKPPILVLATCNPTHNWVKEKVYDRYIKGDMPRTWEYIPAKITDNPYIEPEYIQSLKDNMAPLEYQRFVDGDWDIVKSENPFAYAYSTVRHEGPVTFNPNQDIYISIDFNLNPFGVIFSHQFRDSSGEHLHVFDEFSIENGSVPIMIDRIRAKYGSYLHRAYLTGDAMGNRRDMGQRDLASHYTQLQTGLKLPKNKIVLPANPGHANSRADVNYLLHNFPDVKINPETCPNLCNDMRFVQCDAFGEIIKKNRKDLAQRADHLDCFRYLVNTFLKRWIVEHQKGKRVSIPLK